MRDLQVVHQPERQRYVATVDGEPAGELEYADSDGVRTMLHVGVRRNFKGVGAAHELARVALQEAGEQGLAVVPACRFIRVYAARHPEYPVLPFGTAGRAPGEADIQR